MTAQPTVRRIRSLGAGAVAVILGAVVFLVGPAARPAHACSCVASSEDEHFARADAVFRGHVVDYQPPPPQPVMSSTDPVIWTFAVSEVYKGDVAPTQPVLTASGGASCGTEFWQPGEYFVFASRRDIDGATSDQYYVGLCGGNRPTATGPLAVAALQPATTVATTVPPPPTEVAPVTTATTIAPVVVEEPAPTTTVTVAPASLERQAAGEPEAAMVATREDGDGGLTAGVALAALVVAAIGVGGLGVHRHRRAGGGAG